MKLFFAMDITEVQYIMKLLTRVSFEGLNDATMAQNIVNLLHHPMSLELIRSENRFAQEAKLKEEQEAQIAEEQALKGL
jgi:hypothetical protein